MGWEGGARGTLECPSPWRFGALRRRLPNSTREPALNKCRFRSGRFPTAAQFATVPAQMAAIRLTIVATLAAASVAATAAQTWPPDPFVGPFNLPGCHGNRSQCDLAFSLGNHAVAVAVEAATAAHDAVAAVVPWRPSSTRSAELLPRILESHLSCRGARRRRSAHSCGLES